MVTVIRGEYQLYLAANPEKISSHNSGQEMSERWAVLQQKGTDVWMLFEEIQNKGHGILMAAFFAKISEDGDKLPDKQ
ncbi:hypothetical protein PoB_004838200 [Plakobranchus ocellatus]|uniref:Uncharacterized protein n=1 Tax=Plakobranchus ocellatus TaxID=259542 RepID=A0AAV4BR84_9GAST|nr:hypothetical protein PoB_004838200 [Plakobranchus ocellatus]